MRGEWVARRISEKKKFVEAKAAAAAGELERSSLVEAGMAAMSSGKRIGISGRISERKSDGKSELAKETTVTAVASQQTQNGLRRRNVTDSGAAECE
jgi:hypothetical protein